MKFWKLSFLLLRIASVSIAGCNNNTTNKAEEQATVQSKESGTAGKQDQDSLNQKEMPTSGNTAWLLIPGQSAGITHLNQNAAEIYQRLGPPDGGDAAMQKAVAIWYTNHDSTNHSVAVYTAREPGEDPVARIEQIRVTSPSFQTAEGIHTGSKLKEIGAVYPVQEGETYTDAKIHYRMMDSKKGIAFEMGPDGSCVAIIIHTAGELNGGSTYLKFRTTNPFIRRKQA